MLIMASVSATIFLVFIYVVCALTIALIALTSWASWRTIRARKREIATARDVSDVSTETFQLLGVLDAHDLIAGGPRAIWRICAALCLGIGVTGVIALAAANTATKVQPYVDQPRSYLVIKSNAAGVAIEDDFISWTTEGSASVIQGNWYVYVRPGAHVVEPQPQTFSGTIDGSQVTLRVTSALHGACGVRLVTGQLVGLGQGELDLYDYNATSGKITPLVARQGSYSDFTQANASL